MKRVHFMGIGGVGMAGVAYLTHMNGDDVSGCDGRPSRRTAWLEAAGIPVATGHSPSHLANVDELVVTPAVPKDAPELEAARRAGLRIRPRGEVLAEMVNSSCGIAVCGTHGKTTTSTFTAKLLAALGEDVAWCIGGETGDMPVAGRASRAESQSAPTSPESPFVVEADESDGTLALYRPRILVVTQIDYDHPEHFPTVESYRACYETAIAQSGTVVRAWELDTSDWPELERLVVGRHNAMNARAAIEVALLRGHPRASIAAALPRALSALPDRRFETVAQTSQVRVVSDYAHHPSELACAVSMAASLKSGRLRVLFQPHRHTRTKALCAQFPAAFMGADEIVLLPVYSAFEPPIPGGDVADLYAEFRAQCAAWPHPPTLLLARSAEEAWRHAFLTASPGDLILLAGAGDVVALVPRIKADLASSPSLPSRTFTPLAPHSFFRTGGRTCGRILSALPPDGAPPGIRALGMGSNTWFSDCCTDEDFIRPDLPSGASVLPTHPELAFMAGIPGTLGGWVKMNAGAFGHSISEAVESVVADGRTIPASECGFSYRHSDIPGVVTEVRLKPPPAQPPPGVDTPAAYLARRKAFPPRTCGSVFKNPPAPLPPAGKLLEDAGCKGLRVGGARVWSEHANVIVAGDGCTSSDVLALARLMSNAVLFNSGVRLEPEIRGLGL